MTQLVVALGTVLACWFVGLGFVAQCGTDHRRVPRGLAPVLGVSIWILIAEVARLLPGSSYPLILAVVLAAGLSGLVWIKLARGGQLWLEVRSTLPALIAALAVAAFFVFPWVVDSTLAGTLHFTSNHDAYHFSSGAQWLVDHSSLDAPSITAEPTPESDSPAYVPAMQTLTFPLRDGLELVFASVLAITKLSAYSAWPAVAAAVAGLIASAATGLAQAAKAGRVLAVMAGILVGLSPLAVFQVANQNGASMLGIALTIAVLVLWWRAVGDPTPEWTWGPLIATGVACAALIATYFEGLPAFWLAIPLASLWFIKSVGLGLVLKRVAAVVAVTAVTGLVGIGIAVRSFAVVSAVSDSTRTSPFNDNPVVSGISWILGAVPYAGPDGVAIPDARSTQLTLVLLAVAVLGLVFTLLIPRLWPITLGVTVSMALGWWWWGPHLGSGYAHRRLIEFGGVVVLGLFAAGWATLPSLHATFVASRTVKRESVDDAHESPQYGSPQRRSPPVVALAALVLGACLMMNTANAVNAFDFERARGYGRDYDQVASLVAAHPGRLLVAAPDRLDQAWVGLATANRPGTQFLVPCSCLVGITMDPYVDGSRPEWVLVERGVGTVTGDAHEVGSSGRFVLYRLGSGEVVVASPSLQGDVKTLEFAAEGSR